MALFDTELITIEGKPEHLSDYQGQVLLIVNVASQCGYTPQYAGLEALYRKHKAAGFSILGFPCNQFGQQEPGSNNDVKTFCSLNYDVTFPLFSKTDVNGHNAHPLFRHLKTQRKGLFGTEAIKWNFTKFLLGRDGAVVKRYGSLVTPEVIEKDVERLLAAPKDANLAKPI